MDKDWKLQRYNRKDYTEVVDFPVEIVGRDGVVRRYTFEDSIRLYQRRITFAPVRYRDNELVDAEVHHCRARIEQLRRSYFHRFGWGTPDGQPDVEQIFGDLAGELAAFVCRTLSSSGRPEIRFEQVQAEAAGISVWYVTPRDARSGMLLYVHRFEAHEPDEDLVRQRFFARLRGLEAAGPSEGDGERLIAFHHTVDCGFALTGKASEFNDLLPARVDQQTHLDLSPTPWDDVLELIRRGSHELALTRCQRIVEDQPWHRSAYLAGAMLALVLAAHSVAEELALVASRYFPDDAELHFHLGVARLRQGRVEAGQASLERAIDLRPGLVRARTELVLSTLRQRRYRVALSLLRDRVSAQPDDRRADESLARLEAWLRWRQLILRGGVGLAGLGLATVPLTWLGLVPVACGLSAAIVGYSAFDRQLEEVLGQQRSDQLRRSLRRLARPSQPAHLIS